jgi:predicted flavoprotein YhiN
VHSEVGERASVDELNKLLSDEVAFSVFLTGLSQVKVSAAPYSRGGGSKDDTGSEGAGNDACHRSCLCLPASDSPPTHMPLTLPQECNRQLEAIRRTNADVARTTLGQKDELTTLRNGERGRESVCL